MADVVVIENPYNPKHSSLYWEHVKMSGEKLLGKWAYTLQKTIDELVVSLLPEAANHLNLEVKQLDTLMFGIYTHLQENVHGLNTQGKTTDGSNLASIMLHINVVKDYLKDKSETSWAKVVYYYTVLHEIFHAYLGLGEAKTYNGLVSYMKHMVFVSSGEMRTFYKMMLSYSKARQEGFLQKPYEQAVISSSYAALKCMLSYVEKTLVSGNLSDSARIELKAMKQNLEKKITQAEKEGKGKTGDKIAEGNKASAPKGKEKDAKGKPGAKKNEKSVGSKGKSAQTSKSSSGKGSGKK